MSDFLKQMAATSAERAAAAPEFGSADFDRPVVPLELGGFDVIAEIKQRSPAEGKLTLSERGRVDQARLYSEGGAAAISVLTEPSRFDGSLEHLTEVVDALPETPVMRKDFLVEPVQIDEARAAGASGVLLIVAMLDDGKLRDMLDRAYEHRLFVLLETFDGRDIARGGELLNDADRERMAAGQLLFGVNTRNLRTLEVDPERLRLLVDQLPDAAKVAESGLHTADDAARVAGYGYSMALVGTALMRSDDPAKLIADMKRAGALGLAA